MPSPCRLIVRAYRLLPCACRLPIELRKLRNQMKQFAMTAHSLYSLWKLSYILSLDLNSVKNRVVTSAEEGGYVIGSVCLSVCLFVCLITRKFVNGFLRNFWRGRAWLKDQVIQFWWQSGSRFWSRSPKSEIRILRIGGGLCSLSASSSSSDRHVREN